MSGQEPAHQVAELIGQTKKYGIWKKEISAFSWCIWTCSLDMRRSFSHIDYNDSQIKYASDFIARRKYHRTLAQSLVPHEELSPVLITQTTIERCDWPLVRETSVTNWRSTRFKPTRKNVVGNEKTRCVASSFWLPALSRFYWNPMWFSNMSIVASSWFECRWNLKHASARCVRSVRCSVCGLTCHYPGLILQVLHSSLPF